MALSTHALTTLETMRSELGIKDDKADDRLMRMINAASEAIEQCAGGRHFEHQAGIVERVRGIGQTRMLLDRTPVISIDSIVLLTQANVIQTTYDAMSYDIENAGAGFIFREAGWPWTGRETDSVDPGPAAFGERGALRVTYTGGFVTPAQAAPGVLTRTLPYDLEEACILTVNSLWSRSGYDRNITSSNTDQGPSTSFRSQPEGNAIIGTENPGILPIEALAIVKKYRRYSCG